MIEHNLLANCVRESGDHGPWNSWDRIPYITDVFDTEPDTLPPLKPKGKVRMMLLLLPLQGLDHPRVAPHP